MDNFTKKIILDFKCDKDSLKEVEKEVSDELNKEASKTATKNSFKNQLSEFTKNVFVNETKKLGESFIESLGNLFTDAWSELDNILSYSRLSNRNTRDLMFSYGFNSSQAYGYDKAMSMLGFNSMEDLMYANQTERELFTKTFNDFTARYNKLYDTGFFDEYQRYQVEMAAFKEDMKLEVVQFYMDNKDLIKTSLKSIVVISENVLKVFAWLVDNFGANSDRNTSEKMAKTSDIISSYSNNKTVQVNNTFNHVDSSDRAWLTNIGHTFTQTIAALEGDF